MSQLILTVHSGFHDTGAALFEDYTLRAAVQLERLTRQKSDGSNPDPSIDEVLSISGATRKDVDVIGFSRGEFPTKFYRNVRGIRWIREKSREYLKKRTRRSMIHEILRYKTAQIDDIFKVREFQRASGFRDDAHFYFYNHHEAHALAPLFFTQWDRALIVTADGGGDTVNYSHRHFTDGAITTIYGGEECSLTRRPIDSLGNAYEMMTVALGFIRGRHEGKLTGLAAFGQPVLADEIEKRFFVGDTGRIFSDFRDYHEMRSFIRGLAANVSREDATASIQKVLENVVLSSIGRLLQRHKARHLGLAGGVFANVRLNRVLAEQLPVDEIFIFPAMGTKDFRPAARFVTCCSATACRIGSRSGTDCAICISAATTPTRSTTRSRPLLAFGLPGNRRSTAQRGGSTPARLAQSTPGAWNMGRGRWARARFSPIRREGKHTISSTGALSVPNSCRLRR
jgi:carbamoyltransferase